MACEVTKGLLDQPCKDAVAGLRALYVLNYGEYDWPLETGSEEITALDENITEVFKYVLKNEGNIFEETIETNRSNGTTVFQQELNFVINKIGGAKQFQVKALAWGFPIIFVETNMGDIFVIGRENGCDVSGATRLEGELQGANNYALVANAVERYPIAFLSNAAVAELKTLVSEETL